MSPSLEDLKADADSPELFATASELVSRTASWRRSAPFFALAATEVTGRETVPAPRLAFLPIVRFAATAVKRIGS
jgi:hypothetical protein